MDVFGVLRHLGCPSAGVRVRRCNDALMLDKVCAGAKLEHALTKSFKLCSDKEFNMCFELLHRAPRVSVFMHACMHASARVCAAHVLARMYTPAAMQSSQRLIDIVG